jgi:hypothetical protein
MVVPTTTTLFWLYLIFRLMFGYLVEAWSLLKTLRRPERTKILECHGLVLLREIDLLTLS